MLHKPEYRLKSRSRRDRSVNRRNARTTDKGYENRRIYSLLSRYNKVKRELTLGTITNLLMEQTKNNAGAFVDEASRTLDNGFRNLSNNMAFELFYGGTASRGQISSAGVSYSAPTLSFTLSNPQSVVQFEVGMTMQATTTDGGAALQNVSGTIDAIQITSVNRGTGAITGTVVQGAPQSTWVAGDYLQVLGDIGIGGSSTIAGMLGLSGLASWVPAVDPPSTDRNVVRVKFSLIDLEARQGDRAQAKAA